ncbi:Neuronal acetylcholine receptor subunit alpha-7 [Seminavis robusta]|uniref:Neuronal acetylcholine receptor subunit alpha-7 n=1 Tax=Seminavis robusta TaxID=568900 RepID=A0A9N8ESD9_9STRA|nr:Neuronal acetylcholine receptor subunit alpha-7 [Seminavis robusta]|eukprot:Sro1743_g294820.1 Neuronal acetylcholine receptor subunit alpha-7 (655) ;mRNA; r:18870-20834
MLRLTLLSLLLGAAAVSAPRRPKISNTVDQLAHMQERLRPRVTTSIAIPSHALDNPRLLQAQAPYNASSCSICRGSRVMADKIPFFPPDEELPSLLSNNLTCGELESLAQNFVALDDCASSGIRLLYAQCCEGSVSRYQCESNIRHTIFHNYDPAVPPIPANHVPLNVTVTLETHAVEKIDVQAGTAKILMSLYLEWTDERLQWEQDEDTCAEYVSLWAGVDREKSEVWVPDLDLYNQVDGLQSLPETMALVTSDGHVQWNRNGGIAAFCQFAGLSQIPFDTLGCQFIFGPWVGKKKSDTVLSQEWNRHGTGQVRGNFQRVLARARALGEWVCLSRGGCVVQSVLQTVPKVLRQHLLIPTIILTYVSMGTFLLDLRVGERLSYGMALALVVVAQQIATGGLVPVSNERLWIDKFIGWSFYWVIVGLVESVIIGYLYFMREDKAAKLSPEGGKRIYDGMRASVFVKSTTCKDNRDENEEEEHRVGQSSDLSSINGAGSRPLQEQSALEDISSRPFEEQDAGGVDCDNYASYLEERNSRRTARFSTVNGSIPHQTKRTSSSNHRKTEGFTTLKQHMQHRHAEEPMPVGPATEKELFGPMRWVYTVSLRQVDRFFFFFTLSTYTAFVIAMFVSRPYWGKGLKDVWLDESVKTWDQLA